MPAGHLNQEPVNLGYAAIRVNGLFYNHSGSVRWYALIALVKRTQGALGRFVLVKFDCVFRLCFIEV